jgi:hypothetical protein
MPKVTIVSEKENKKSLPKKKKLIIEE